ncbi:hypothetical protein PInf_007732 [Phytophthora infestans]|nr:hypothetical protein PInf_007732 [Phytophthora infestans]
MIFALEPGTKRRIYAGCFTARDNSKARVVDILVEKGQAIRKHRFYCEKNPKGAANKQKRKREYEEGEYKCEVCDKVLKHQELATSPQDEKTLRLELRHEEPT